MRKTLFTGAAALLLAAPLSAQERPTRVAFVSAPDDGRPKQAPLAIMAPRVEGREPTADETWAQMLALNVGGAPGRGKLPHVKAPKRPTPKVKTHAAPRPRK